MPRTPRRLQQKAWDATSARYASLDHPEWKLMDRLPAYFWEDQHNHKRYMQWLGRELGYSKPEDWYQVTSKDFVSRRGSGVLEYHDNSVFVVLRTHFPKFDWKPWLFTAAPNGYWNDLNNCFAYLECTEYFSKAKKLTPYWYRPHELFARAFESFVEDSLHKKGWVNEFLVKGTRENYDAARGVPYPQGAERLRINKAIGKLLRSFLK